MKGSGAHTGPLGRGSRALKALVDPLDGRLFPRESRYWQLVHEWLLPECRTVLDVGCGANGALVRNVPGIPFTVGVDVVTPNSDPTAPRHTEYRRHDVRELSELFKPGSFDGVVALDVIEHLPREDGKRLVEAMESVAARRVLIFTPNGFLPQSPEPANPFQEHLSGWSPDDFLARGYQVVGVNGWRPLRGPYGACRWHPRPVWRRVSGLTESFVTARPRHAFHLACRKDL